LPKDLLRLLSHLLLTHLRLSHLRLHHLRLLTLLITASTSGRWAATMFLLTWRAPAGISAASALSLAINVLIQTASNYEAQGQHRYKSS
jgi:hypothetical protein